MDGQNEDKTSRRKFLTGAGIVGAAAAVTAPAAANAVTQQTELSPEQISKLEGIVKNFITNAEKANIQPLGPALALMGHGSHNNEVGEAPTREMVPTTTQAPPKAATEPKTK